MLSFLEARSLLLSRVTPLQPEAVAVADADGRVLREDVVAPFDLPGVSASAMDGYALRLGDCVGAGPFELEVEGESRAGRPAEPLAHGKAQRISTGAEVPAGADTVVPQEQTSRTGDLLRIEAPLKLGQHIRRRGEDLEQGQIGLASGQRLGPAALGLCAALDRASVWVGAAPRVQLLCTGDELRPAGSGAAAGSIPDSISVGLAALCRRAGARVGAPLYARDTREETERAIAAGLESADVLVTVGGVSVGAHDWIRPALEARGVVLDFWKVAIKPGKPLALGRAGANGPWVLALPGNPASALITFGLFGLPLLRALQGDIAPVPSVYRLPLGRDVRHKSGRLEFLRARLDFSGASPCVMPLDNQASGALTSLAQADAWALIPAEVDDLAAGSSVELLRWQDL